MTVAEYWLLLPVGVLIATVYTSTGISGANFWVPVYLLWLGLDAALAFWLALVTMLFGSLSGLLRHARQRTLEPRRALTCLAASVPAALAGAWLAPLLPTGVLVAGFGVFALLYAVYLAAGGGAGAGRRGRGGDLLAAAAGGLGVGTISVGLGALLLARWLGDRAAERQRTVAGTVLLAVFVTSLAAALSRLRPELVAEIGRQGRELWRLLAFAVPAVLLGGQLGPRLAARLDELAMRRYAAVVLAVVGLLMLLRAWRLV